VAVAVAAKRLNSLVEVAAVVGAVEAEVVAQVEVAVHRPEVDRQAVVVVPLAVAVAVAAVV
jgi:hypothetical protein